MKLKSNFVTHATADGMLMISAGGSFNGMVRSNDTAAYIIELLKTETDRDGIIAGMLERYDATEAQIAADVDAVLAKLRSIGAIDE